MVNRFAGVVKLGEQGPTSADIPQGTGMDSIFHPLNGFLHPSEMTPEERLDELAHIFAAGLLRLKAGVLAPEKESQHIDVVGDKYLQRTESCLEVLGQRRLHVARK